MLGAIVGDIMGSSMEFEEQKFEHIAEINLFNEENHFTDDTVLTLAVADWLLHDIHSIYYDDEKLRIALGRRLVKWTQRYRDKEIAYGLSYMEFFYRAELTDEYRPQNSYGNGSAMRVSPVGWFFDTIEETMRFAKISADVTHNHPEGQKGAVAVACAIFLARTGESKEYIKNFILRAFGYERVSQSFFDLRKVHSRNCTAQGSVPEAIVSFLESKDFESAIRLAISFGGDADTMAAISGSIAEAYYGGVPDHFVEYAKKYMDNEAIGLCEKFYKRLRREK